MAIKHRHDGFERETLKTNVSTSIGNLKSNLKNSVGIAMLTESPTLRTRTTCRCSSWDEEERTPPSNGGSPARSLTRCPCTHNPRQHLGLGKGACRAPSRSACGLSGLSGGPRAWAGQEAGRPSRAAGPCCALRSAAVLSAVAAVTGQPGTEADPPQRLAGLMPAPSQCASHCPPTHLLGR